MKSKSDIFYVVFGGIFLACYIVMFISALTYIWSSDYMCVKVFVTAVAVLVFSGILGKAIE